jgi:glycosyltransferase involved in cell wall biosynthesis
VFNEVLIPVFLLCVTIQLGYALYFFSHVFKTTNSQSLIPNSQLQPVTVIICAKNEADNLSHNLPSILAQRYSNEVGNAIYEVIVVNDASTDGTKAVLEGFIAKYNHLKVIHISPDERHTLPGKKYALSRGVALAKYDFIVMTDADCIPASNTWLYEIATPLHEGKQIVAGYGKYRQTSGLLNTFIRWETMHTFIQYAGYAIAGKPYMAVGRNLACAKDTLLKAQESMAWGMLPSGDDDLLIRSQATTTNMAIISNDNSFTISDAKDTWSSWFKQKQRHISTGKYYKWGIKYLLAMYANTHALCWLSFIGLLFTGSWQLALGVMAVRCIVYWTIWYNAANVLQEKNVVALFPFMDIGWALYNFALSPYILLKNKQQWT